MRIRKGYVLVTLFALGIAVAQALKYRVFTTHDLGPETYKQLSIQILLIFINFEIPGMLLVYWYYRMKEKRDQ